MIPASIAAGHVRRRWPDLSRTQENLAVLINVGPFVHTRRSYRRPRPVKDRTQSHNFTLVLGL